MYCYKCPYIMKIQRKYGVTTHCNLEPTNMDVSYYIETEKRNTLCPFVCKGTRFDGVNYNKYINCNIANWIMEYDEKNMEKKLDDTRKNYQRKKY